MASRFQTWATGYRASNPIPASKGPAPIEIAGVRVVFVDGVRLRDDHSDFALGGAHGRYEWIPDGEAWIDRTQEPADSWAVVAHEVSEILAMRSGAPYGAAHEAAVEAETAYRAATPPTERSRRSVETYLAEHAPGGTR